MTPTATIGIEVPANTSAAQRALHDLGEATREAMTAADGAGESQKTLAQKIAAAKEQQLAATDAVRRAQAALAEHNATVQTHGRESKEAAESLARLRTAQAEAAKQADVADKAIAGVATETAAAVREADKLTPALARAAREVKATGASAERTSAEVRRLDLALTAAAKAGDVSGEAQRGLAQKIAATTEQQLAATEAVQRAQRAMAEHTVTVARYGKESREAAESLAKLRAAQAEAARQAAAADRALEAASRALAAVAATAEGKTNPALRQMDEALVRISKDADRSASELRTLDARMSLTTRSTSTLGQAASTSGENISAMGMLSKGAGALGLVALAGAAAQAGQALVEASAEVMAFDAAAANVPFGLDRARKATRGLVSDMQLARSAAQGLALGVVASEDEFAALAEAATKLGIKFNLGPTQALDNMMTALGRGSTELLDNLGVVLKVSEAQERFAASIGKSAGELTDAEKKVAFKTEAIRALQKAASETVVDLDSGAAAIQRVGVNAENAKMSLKGLAVEGVGELVRAGEQMSHALSDEHIAEQIAQVRAYSDEMFLLEKATRARSAAEQEYLRHIGKDVLDASKDELAIMEVIGKVAFDNAHSFGELDGELLHHWGTVKDFTASLWKQADAYAQATKAARDHAAAQKTAEDDLWSKLQKRHDKAEDGAIEDAFFAANEMGPQPAPGFKRPTDKRGKAKKPAEFLDPGDVSIMRGHDGVAESEGLADQAQGRREDDDYAREEEGRERRIAGLEREAQALQEMSVLERERVDLVFFDLEVRNAAADRHEELIRRRMDAEIELARWQVKNAKTNEQRERAQTRLEEAEGKKRLMALREFVDAEAKENARRQKVVATVKDAVVALGEAMIGAIEAMVEGEKGALARMLSELLKATAKKNALLALEQFALAAASAASYNFPGAAAHAAAGGMHTAVAAAAGLGAVAAGKVWEANREPPKTEEDKWQDEADRKARKDAWSGKTAGGGAGSGGAGSGSSEGDGLEAQEVPVSHEQMRRSDASGRGAGGGVQIVINNPHIYGAGGAEAFAKQLAADIERINRGGRRPRN